MNHDSESFEFWSEIESETSLEGGNKINFLKLLGCCVNGSELNPWHWDGNARLSGKLSLDHFPTNDLISKSI